MWVFFYLKNIPGRNRAQFINDLFAFSQANLIDPLKPLKLLSYLSSEDEYVAWQAAIKQITYLKDLIDSTPIYGLYRTYVLKLVSPIYTTLGWSENINDSSLTR
jgi:aminopeptidase N